MKVAERAADASAGWSSREWFVCLALFAAALLPRIVYLILFNPGFEGYHWIVADTLLRQGFLGVDDVKTTEYEPLYPLFLSLARAPSGDNIRIIQALQAVVDSIGAVYLYRLAKHLSGRQRTAVLSAMLYALYPLLIRHAVVGDEFALLSTLLIVFADTLVTATTLARAAAAGMWLGLAILTRAMILPVLGLTFAMLIIDGRKKMALACAMTAIVVVSPLLVRNYLLDGAILPTRSGVNLFFGNSKYTAALLPDYSVDLVGDYIRPIIEREQPELFASTAEKELDGLYMAKALEEMRARPLETLELTLSKVAYFFWPRLVPSRVITSDTRVLFGPDGQVSVANSPRRPLRDEVAYSVSYGMVAVAALFGLWLRRCDMKRDAVLWCILLTFVATYAIYFPATRYRVSTEFVLLFYAGAGLDWCTQLLSRRVSEPA